jgi:ethylbenzene hydroxylase subunit beta/complex iron-sulfur molybdoenzyme family reductase subunit beta
LHAEFGTKPNVYYVPPLSPPRLDGDGNIDASQPRVPMDYLRSLFGPEVDNAIASLKNEIEKKRNKEESELMDILIVRRWQELLGSFGKDPSEVQA